MKSEWERMCQQSMSTKQFYGKDMAATLVILVFSLADCVAVRCSKWVKLRLEATATTGELRLEASATAGLSSLK